VHPEIVGASTVFRGFGCVVCGAGFCIGGGGCCVGGVRFCGVLDVLVWSGFKSFVPAQMKAIAVIAPA